ncbi:SIMPL domain-containing protein [Microbacterium paulum]
MEWQLTPETNARVERETAARAVAVAVDRATAYATALGKRTVTPLEVADAGLLSGDGTPPVAAPRMFARAASADVAPSAVEFRPDDVVVTAAVEARFTTI